MDIETQLKSNICQLVNTGKQSWQKEKKEKEKEKKKKSEYCKLRSTSEAAFGILPTKQESMWELNSARKGDTLCILNKYKVNRNYNLFMRFHRVQLDWK